MKFEQLDRRMRVYETAHDHCVLPGMHMVARIDDGLPLDHREKIRAIARDIDKVLAALRTRA